MVFTKLPVCVALYFTAIEPSLSGIIGVVGHSATVQPQEETTSLMNNGALPVFVK